AYAFFNYFEITQAQIRRLDLVITTASEEKIYDGTPLSNDNWFISSGNLLNEDTIHGVMETVITDVGVVENVIGITILDANNYNVTNNYNIVYELGTLTILPRPLGIYTESQETVYDGTVLSHKVWG